MYTYLYLTHSLTHSLTVAIPPGGGIGGAAHNRSVSIPHASPAVVCTQKIGTGVPQLVPISIFISYHIIL